LHVDLKFVTPDELAVRVENPDVLWEHERIVSDALQTGIGRFPAPNIQWIEDRFWVWVHYSAGKIGRGELFEALDLLSFLSSNVLGPLALQKVGKRPSGVRKIESLAPDFARRLEATLATHNASDCVRALRVCV
jgi:hypothetical protein